ncbi:C40 family peptidase [Nocardioides sp. GY 10127]|uniref:C40 family peptidase n=1 Tax=Nocardioides sp. GY 10127 TaxID=2569762 RepID=UPI0010A7AF17|nr:C40 family peptidase [Nocardioides sp. GY 10127]TIC79380.1 hypothetical protein E8D37_17485 [Nocardioides sp. GY 10127]
MIETESRPVRLGRRPQPRPSGVSRALSSHARSTRAVAGSLALAAVLGVGMAAPADARDGGEYPSKSDVKKAREAVTQGEADVASVRAELALAAQRLEAAQIEAAKAAEKYNGALYRAQQARKDAKAAQKAADDAADELEARRASYVDVVTASYQMAPELSTLGALADAGQSSADTSSTDDATSTGIDDSSLLTGSSTGDSGLDTLLSTMATVQSTREAMDRKVQEITATSTVAKVTARQATRAAERAARLAAKARTARDAAQAAQDSAAAEASSVAQRRDALIARLAVLQKTSVRVARERQEALEAEARREARQAARQAAREAARKAARQAARQKAAAQAAAQAAQSSSSSSSSSGSSSSSSSSSGSSSSSSSSSGSSSSSSSGGSSTSASGVAAVLAFARAQIGEPYVWAAAGPDSWDCSGLTMMAWAQAGVSLAHYTVAQYEETTHISMSQLQPGDLLFWGTSSDPSSIYHVAIYAGNGMMIHAPHTGDVVKEVSMYEWTLPNFFGRP